jgi:hypothetical protein
MAQGCLAEALAQVTGALTRRPATVSDHGAWNRIDSVLFSPTPGARAGCAVSASPVGARLDVNKVGESLISDVLRHAGATAGASDSIAAAIADWRDADDLARPFGAERDWYVRRGEVPPRNRPFTDGREIGLVRGMASVSWKDLFDVEPGPISINHASSSVLRTLPGFSQEVVDSLMALRQTRSIGHFQELVAGPPNEPMGPIMEALPQLASMVSLQPTAWLLRSEAWAGAPRMNIVIELRLERTALGVRIARRRIWIN